jgi:hypothetical protein
MFSKPYLTPSTPLYCCGLAVLAVLYIFSSSTEALFERTGRRIQPMGLQVCLCESVTRSFLFSVFPLCYCYYTRDSDCSSNYSSWFDTSPTEIRATCKLSRLSFNPAWSNNTHSCPFPITSPRCIQSCVQPIYRSSNPPCSTITGRHRQISRAVMSILMSAFDSTDRREGSF